jgi:hypothetical protein
MHTNHLNSEVYHELSVGVKLDKEQWYGHVPVSAETSQEGKVVILRNKQVQTDRTISNNKPHIIIHDNEKGICMLIDAAISRDRNVIKIEAGHILRYKDLTTEINSMWNVKTNVIPVIIGATGTTFKIIQKIPEQCTGNSQNQGTRETAILDMAHILQKVLMKKYNRLNNVNSVICAMNSSYRIAPMLYEQGLFQVYKCKYTA